MIQIEDLKIIFLKQNWLKFYGLKSGVEVFKLKKKIENKPKYAPE